MIIALDQLKNIKCDGYNKDISKLYLDFVDTKQIKLETILKKYDLETAISAARCLNDTRDIQLFGVWCACLIKKLVIDDTSSDILKKSELFMDGLISIDEMQIIKRKAANAANLNKDNISKVSYYAASLVLSKSYCIYYTALIIKTLSIDYIDITNDMFTKMCNNQAPWQNKID